jgi:protoheme IX farnesyltransferase
MEKEIDALMERTRSRPLPSGRISSQTALTFGLSLILGSLTVLYFLVNPLTALLGAVAGVVYIFMYTPMKRKTSMALFAGAIPGAIPPLMGWTTVMNSVDTLGLVLFGILFVWQLPHFLSIAIYHSEDYKEASIKTHPAHIGIRGTVHRIAVYTYILFLISVVPYWIGVTTEGYRNALFLLGGGYFFYSLFGYTYKEDSKELLTWARRYFYGSLIYLPSVFILMIYFKINS